MRLPNSSALSMAPVADRVAFLFPGALREYAAQLNLSRVRGLARDLTSSTQLSLLLRGRPFRPFAHNGNRRADGMGRSNCTAVWICCCSS
jgi:hypothetical protein